MKIIAVPIVALFTLLLVECMSVAKADEPLCYIRTSNRRVINLTKYCGRTPQNPSNSDRPGEAMERVLSDSSTAYADAFCQARAEGLASQQAEEKARTAASLLVRAQQFSQNILSDTWLQSARAEGLGLCPDLQSD